jgi:hypothetical protein
MRSLLKGKAGRLLVGKAKAKKGLALFHKFKSTKGQVIKDKRGKKVKDDHFIL